MIDHTTDAVRVTSRPGSFRTTAQSFEILNHSKRAVTIGLDKSGSECFRIPPALQTHRLKPGQSIRAQIEFSPPARGKPMTLTATYRATIKVWLKSETHGAKDRLVDVLVVTGIGPGLASPRDLHCFDPLGARESSASRKRRQSWRRRR